MVASIAEPAAIAATNTKAGGKPDVRKTKLPPGFWPEGSIDRKLRSFSRYGVVVVLVVVEDDDVSVDGAMVESVVVSAGGVVVVSLV
jgi:hypothetical protein